MVARSGMSTLFKATDLRMGRQVAIKVPMKSSRPTRFCWSVQAEEQIGQELDHPGVVKTYDGEQRSRVYMVIEWVEGRLLRSLLNQKCRNESCKLPIDRL